MNRKYRKLGAFLLAMVLLVTGGIITPRATYEERGHGEGSGLGEVYVGGMSFGVKFYTEGILVVGFCDVDAAASGGGVRRVNPAREGGLRVRDVIVGVNGETPDCAATLTRAVEASAGAPVTLTVRRGGQGRGSRRPGRGEERACELTLTVTPVRSVSEDRYKTGLWVRDSGAGIGTVTFICPGSKAFVGLGHGICDGDTGELVPLRRGQVTGVRVSGIERGQPGSPGAIKGYFAPGKRGVLLGNTECGVYGVFSRLPAESLPLLPLGRRQELCEGEATVLCALDQGEVEAYRVRITSVDREATGSKCFTLSVTDPGLMEKTGGIVQGMSGSPVIQNGKLMGAVTHVLVNDPTAGYGIFIENMLEVLPRELRE